MRSNVELAQRLEESCGNETLCNCLFHAAAAKLREAQNIERELSNLVRAYVVLLENALSLREAIKNADCPTDAIEAHAMGIEGCPGDVHSTKDCPAHLWICTTHALLEDA